MSSLKVDKDYKKLKIQIKENPELLKDLEIKRRVINSHERYSFLDFVFCEISYEAFTTLFDSEGIDIFGENISVEDKIQHLLESPFSLAKEYLFEQPGFCKIVQAHVNNLRTCLNKNMTEKCAIFFMKYIIDNNLKEATSVYFFVINQNFQLSILKNLAIPLELFKSIITATKYSRESLSMEAVRYLVEEKVPSLTGFTIEEIFEIIENVDELPGYLLEEREFVKRISSMDSVKNYRLLVDKLNEHNDVSIIEEARKRYYDKEIDSFIPEENMFSRYFQFYQEICTYIGKYPKDLELIGTLINKYFVFSEKHNRNIFYKNIHGLEFRSYITVYFLGSNKEGLRKFLEEESHRQLTNMVIDYHYEVIPYNFFLDLRQLLKFQEEGERTLSDQEIEFYARLIEMDSMPYEELKELHERLKKYPVMENLYDHFRTAKDKVIALMNKSVLNKETIQKYKNDELSEKYGVGVYVLDGDDFSAYIRGYEIPKKDNLLENSVRYDINKNSFSLVGSSQLGTFFSPKEFFNFIYLTPMPEDQVAHICSGPSYSIFYKPNITSPSTWLYELCTPEDLLNTTDEYTEIVVNVPDDRRDDELNEKLVRPQIFGLFCYDEITDLDVLNAKNTGNSIVLVKTEAYKDKCSIFPRRSKKYINQTEEDDMDNRRKNNK